MFKNINFNNENSIESFKIQQRINRAKTQKIYLINRNIEDKTAKFSVMGHSGNIYEIILSGSPTCSCPDFLQRKKRCKHIFFMLTKIFSINDPNKESFTQNEIEQYINNYKLNIKNFNLKYDSKSNSIDVGIKDLDDNCCICLDIILNGDSYVYCKEYCGKCIHYDCYNMVVKKTSKCPYCTKNFKCSEIIS